ncbi:MAG: multidrug effflux MFS transporter [Proteobacteria bacterium]|nr:multidrug effflux MFS transporter [Pseudomonadota bacterium]
MSTLFPPIWLIIFIIGLPQLSESVYSPSLPEIALFLKTHESFVEMTLSIYLIGFAIGSLFFGIISDKYGRKPSILGGIFIFLMGSILCSLATSIDMLLISRFIQAFGGSIGSVLGQAICRDAFKGKDLAKIYSTVGSCLPLFPALGPIVGTVILTFSKWQGIFYFLIIMALILTVLVVYYLPETLHEKKEIEILTTLKKMIKNQTILKYGLFIGLANGISFSYYAESPFFFKEILKMDDVLFGISFLGISTFVMAGAMYNKKLIDHISQDDLIKKASNYIMVIAILLAILPFFAISDSFFIVICLGLLCGIFFFIPMITGNALSSALKDFKDSIGTASSIFGFYYYIIVSLTTGGMAILHNGTLFAMPFYFLVIALLMFYISRGKR